MTNDGVAGIIAAKRQRNGETVRNTKKCSCGKKILLWLIICCLIAAGMVMLLCGGGKVGQITVDNRGDFYNTEELYHGTPKDTKKTATLSYTQSTGDSFVFLKVNAENWSFEVTTACYSTLNGQVYWNVDSGWTYFLTEGKEQIFYMFVPEKTTLENVPIIADEIVKVATDVNYSKYHATAREGRMDASFSAVAVKDTGKQTDVFIRAQAAWEKVTE